MRRQSDRHVIQFPEMRLLNDDALHAPVAAVAVPRAWFVRRWSEFRPNPDFARVFCTSALAGICPHRDKCSREFCERDKDEDE